MTEEMRLHVEQRTREGIAAGLTPEEARRTAYQKFGHVDSIQETCRDQRAGVWLEQFGRDLRFSLRSLRRSPGFSAAVILTLALCLGPNTAILSTLYALVYKPPPFRDAKELVYVVNVAEKKGEALTPLSFGQYRDFRAHADLFEAFAGIRSAHLRIEWDDGPAYVIGWQTTADFLPLLGVKPLLGRFFTEQELETDARVMVLSRLTWETRFNRDPRVLGREVRVDGAAPYTIVGVAPRNLEALDVRNGFIIPDPLGKAKGDPQGRYAGRILNGMGRLKSGVTQPAAAAQLNALELSFRNNQASAEALAVVENEGLRIRLGPLYELWGGMGVKLKNPLLLLQVAALFVFLIGGVNVVNLLLARLNAKRPELAIRHALGAGQGILLRQIILESLLLVLAASLIGGALAWGALQIINRYLPVLARTMPPVTLDLRVLGLIFVVMLVLALLMAAIPFRVLWRGGLAAGGARSVSAGRATRAASSALVVIQVAVSLVLLVGAGLLIRSFAHVTAIKPGFDAEQLATARLSLPAAYNDADTRMAAKRRILAAMKEIAGVEAVAFTWGWPIAAFDTSTLFRAPIRLQADAAVDQQARAFVQWISSDYFVTMGIPLLEGRSFSDSDGSPTSPVAWVDQTFADRFLGGRNPLGQEIFIGEQSAPIGPPGARIVGVVARANLSGLEDHKGMPFVFIPTPAAARDFSLLLRTRRNLPDVLGDARKKLRDVDPSIPLYGLSSLQTGMDDLLMNRRGIVLLLGVFAGLALLLAGVGLYGVLAYDVSQRTREIGIRGAIGASRQQILAQILRQGLWKTGVGLATGLVAAVFLTRYLESLLFEVKRGDPLSYAAVSALLLVVALLASYLPAWRAAKVDPIVALRCE